MSIDTSHLTDAFWLEMAKHYADKASKDPSTKVGAVIVRPDRTPASWGFNGFPKGIADTPERLADRDWKYPLTIHAELNAIMFLRERATGYTIYCTFAPCFDKCAAPIIQAGIKRVVFYASDNERWRDGQAKAVDLFKEAGMEVRVIDPVSEETTFWHQPVALGVDDSLPFISGQSLN